MRTGTGPVFGSQFEVGTVPVFDVDLFVDLNLKSRIRPGLRR